MNENRFTTLAGNCKGCGVYKHWQDAYLVKGSRWIGDALNLDGYCRDCAKEKR